MAILAIWILYDLTGSFYKFDRIALKLWSTQSEAVCLKLKNLHSLGFLQVFG